MFDAFDASDLRSHAATLRAQRSQHFHNGDVQPRASNVTTPLPRFHDQPTLDYSRGQLEKKELKKHTAESQKSRIREWQEGLVQEEKEKPLPTQKPLPPLPARTIPPPKALASISEDQCKRKRFTRLLGLKKKNEAKSEVVDFCSVLGSPVGDPSKIPEDDEETLTALPQMPDSSTIGTSGTSIKAAKKRESSRKLTKTRKFE